jgi:hypothetical protein
MDVPGKFEVSALWPAIELKSVLLPLFGWPMKMTVGTLGLFMDEFDEDFLGDASAEGDRGVRTAAADEERAPEDGLAVELDGVALMKAKGHEAAADALAANEVDDPQGGIMGRTDEVHGSPSFKFIQFGRGIKRFTPRPPVYTTKIIGINAAGVNPRLPGINPEQGLPVPVLARPGPRFSFPLKGGA